MTYGKDELDIKASITIDLDIESIYSFISDLKNLTHYWTKVKNVELVSGDGGVGSAYKVIFPTLIGTRTVEIEVVEATATPTPSPILTVSPTPSSSLTPTKAPIEN